MNYDVAAVIERYGLRPDQIADYKGLKGDTSDNIPGVPGIGEKTATKLLQEFDSVEAIYDRIDEVKPEKLRENLREHERAGAHAAPSWRRSSARCRRRSTSTRAGCAASTATQVEELFHELEFRSLVSRLPAVARRDAVGAVAPASDARIGASDRRRVSHDHVEEGSRRRW